MLKTKTKIALITSITFITFLEQNSGSASTQKCSPLVAAKPMPMKMTQIMQYLANSSAHGMTNNPVNLVTVAIKMTIHITTIAMTRNASCTFFSPSKNLFNFSTPIYVYLLVILLIRS